MIKTDIVEFHKELLAKGEYITTPEQPASRRSSPSAWVTFCFSMAVGKVFPMSALWDLFHKMTPLKWGDFCYSALTVVERFGMNLSITGLAERNAYKGPVMYLSNHMSTYETIALPAILLAHGPIGFAAKESLSRLPLLVNAARIMGMIGLGRTNPKEDLLKLYKEGGAHIANGRSFLIYPQGTRNEVFSRKHFSSIGAKLAEKTGIPIVPVVVDTRCMPTRQHGLLRHVFKDFGPIDTSKDVRIAFGPVIPCTKSRAMHEACITWMEGKLKEMGLPVDEEK